jgi:2-polyprenyl-3-methyl-5-hydroxy-6-metoxy-1,4-benzoquinol methylase
MPTTPVPADATLPADGFTAHNIRLDDGTETFPSAGWLISQSGFLHAARRMLQLVFPEGLRGKSIADLGCLEGGYATEFARLGMLATGIEVRESNFRNCLRVKAGVNLPNLGFIRDDVANIGKYGPFDAIFAAGVLYHLENPRRFLTDAARVCRRVMFLETHIARAEPTRSAEIHSLSDVTEHEGLRGRWYPEYDKATPEQLERMKWHSWLNNRSFWVQKEYLLQLLKDLGFDIVLEQYDCDGDIVTELTTGNRKISDRVFLVAIKSAQRSFRRP